jgi:hypothetical protein
MNHIKQSAYLNKCDLISKYNVESIQEIPSVSRLHLYIKSWEYLESSKSDLKSINFEENSQIKSILLLYTLNALSPSIKTSKKIEIYKNKPIVKNLGYLLKASVSEKKNISTVLNWLLVENVSQIVISGWNSKLIKKDKSKITLSFTIPFHILKESEDFGVNYLKDISLKNINLHLDLTFDSKINNFNLNTLFPFWING